MADHPELVAEVDCDGEPADVDTLDDLAELEARLAGRHGIGARTPVDP